MTTIVPVITDPSPGPIETAIGIPAAAVTGAATGAVALVQVLGNALAKLAGDENAVIEEIASTSRTLQALDDAIGTQFANVYANNQTISDIGSLLIPGIGVGNAITRAKLGATAIEKLANVSEKLGESIASRAIVSSSILGIPANYTQKAIVERQAQKLLAGDYEALGKLLSVDRAAYSLSSAGAWTLDTAIAELGTIALQLNNPIYEDINDFSDALRTAFGTGLIFGGLAGGFRFALGLKNVEYTGNKTLGSLKQLGIDNFEFLTQDVTPGALAKFSPNKGALFASNLNFLTQSETGIVKDLRGLEKSWAKHLPTDLQKEWEAGLTPRARQIKNFLDANYAEFVKEFAEPQAAERLFRAIKSGEFKNFDILSGIDSVRLPSLATNSFEFLAEPKSIAERLARLDSLVKKGKVDQETAMAMRKLLKKDDVAEIMATLAKKDDYEKFRDTLHELSKAPAKLPLTKNTIDTIWGFVKADAWPTKVDTKDFTSPSKFAFLRLDKKAKLIRNPEDLSLGDFVRTEIATERLTAKNLEQIVDVSRREFETALSKAWQSGALRVSDELNLPLPNFNLNVKFFTDFTFDVKFSPLAMQAGWEAAKRLTKIPESIKSIPIDQIESPFIAYARWLNETDSGQKAALRAKLDELLDDIRGDLVKMGIRPGQIKFLTNPENDFLQSKYLQVRLTDSPPYAKLDQFAAAAVAAQNTSDKVAATIARSYATTAAITFGFGHKLERYTAMIDAAKKTHTIDALNESGQGFISNSTARANSLQAALQLSGQYVNKVSQEVQKDLWNDLLPVYQEITRLSDEGLIELNLIHQKIMSTPLGWVHVDGRTFGHLDSAVKETDGTVKYTETFEINNAAVFNFWMKVYNLSQKFGNAVASLEGKKVAQRPIYFPQVKSSQRPWVAFIDEFASETIGSTGFRQMIHARTEEELSQRVRAILETVGGRSLHVKTNSSNLKVDAKSLGELTVDKKLKGLYDLKEAFSEFQVDSSLKRSGRYGDYDVRLGHEIVDEYVEWVLASSKNFVRDTFKQSEIELFAQLETRSLALQPYSQSQKGKFYKEDIDGFGDNTYSRMMRLALDYKPNERYEWVSRWQSNTARAINQTLSSLHSLAQRGYENLDEKDLKHIATTYAEYAKSLGLSSEKFTIEYIKTLPKSMQTPKYVEIASQALNAFQATFHLGLDWFNALTNAVSTPFVLSSAVRQFQADVKGVTGNSMIFAARTLKEFWENLPAINYLANPEGKARPDKIPSYLTELFDWGILNDGHKLILQDISKAMNIPKAISTDSSKLMEYVGAAMRIAQEPTAKTELFSSYVAARYGQVMGEKLGASKEIQAIYANTLRQYATGGLIASQRPILFSGWLGNAFGLYKSFMLNVFQNSLQHLADGRMRDFLALVGIQTFTFGVRGSALGDIADRLIFQHNRDDYQGIDTTIPGNILLYGAASWITQSNLFTRGDLSLSKEFLNPLNSEAYAALNSTLKTFGVIGKAIGGDMSVGAAMQEILLRQQINRPLQRLAEMSAGVRYDKNGKPMVFIENWSPWAIAIRGMGGAPLDESVAVDAYYRFADKLWQNTEDRRELAAATRKMLLLDPEDIDWNDVVQKYVRYGGNPDTFRAWLKSLAEGVSEDAQLRMARQLKHTPALQFWLGLEGG